MNFDQELIDRSRKFAHSVSVPTSLDTVTMQLVALIFSLAAALEESNRRGVRAEAAVHNLVKALEDKHEPKH